MSLLTSFLETFFGDENDAQAIEDLQGHLEGDPEQARELQAEWLAVLERHDETECLELSNRHALRLFETGHESYAWLRRQYAATEPFFNRLNSAACRCVEADHRCPEGQTCGFDGLNIANCNQCRQRRAHFLNPLGIPIQIDRGPV